MKGYPNGVDGSSGAYLTQALNAECVVRRAAGWARDEAALDELVAEAEQVFSVRYGVDPLRVDSAGWGMIFADDAPPEVRLALRPLLEWRHSQGGHYVKEFSGIQGYRNGMSSEQFLVAHGSAPGQPADPEFIPYYLLIIGDPTAIPFEFQYGLGLQYAVGRIAFADPSQYANYARSVILAEQSVLRRARQVALFGPACTDDDATIQSSQHLVEPLAAALHSRRQAAGWEVASYLAGEASRERLTALVSAGPALLFSATHGVGFPCGHPSQARHQGALLCQDWPGPVNHVGALPPEFYYSADDAERGAGPAGLVAMLFACYGAGTPEMDDFADSTLTPAPNFSPPRLAPAPIVASLVQALLGHPDGGALAVVGHVDRAWGWSFAWPGTRTAQLAVFQDALLPLMDGCPLGHAMDVFRHRHGELAAVLAIRLAEIRNGRSIADPDVLAAMWTAHTDARNYLIMGDPAVRLAL
jgi:hypothetical protein